MEKVLEERGTGKNRQYLIKWKGYPSSSNSWEPEKNIPRRDLLVFRGHPVKPWPWLDPWELAVNETEEIIVQGKVYGKQGYARGEQLFTSPIEDGVVREDADGWFVMTKTGSYYSL